MTAQLTPPDQAEDSRGRHRGRRGGDEHVMDPQEFRVELESRGLTVLGVGQHRTNPEVLVVYLHGNEGQWVDGAARRTVALVPGVLSVVDSVQSPTILLVRTGLGPDGEPLSR